jgi:hypothetical protein
MAPCKRDAIFKDAPATALGELGDVMNTNAARNAGMSCVARAHRLRAC